VCGVCLVVEVWIAARFPGPTTLVSAVVTAIEGGLAWLARMAYGRRGALTTLTLRKGSSRPRR